jgi:K+-sensing histidine kinase KdpD
MRATCEFSEQKGLPGLPEINVQIYKTKDDITIKISDLGEGIKRKASSKMFN